jgi:hypothetical protein
VLDWFTVEFFDYDTVERATVEVNRRVRYPLEISVAVGPLFLTAGWLGKICARE